MQAYSTSARIRRGFARIGFIALIPCLLAAFGGLGVSGYHRLFYSANDYLPDYTIVDLVDGKPNPQGTLSTQEANKDKLVEAQRRYENGANESLIFAALAAALGLIAFLTIIGIGWAISGFFN